MAAKHSPVCSGGARLRVGTPILDAAYRDDSSRT
jgi:hypothetical protein